MEFQKFVCQVPSKLVKHCVQSTINVDVFLRVSVPQLGVPHIILLNGFGYYNLLMLDRTEFKRVYNVISVFTHKRTHDVYC